MAHTKFFALLDSLRAVAALSVVYFHLVVMALPGGGLWPLDRLATLAGADARNQLDFGWFGVALFFFISGFVITHAGRRETRAEFALKRLLRILPPYLVVTLLAFILVMLKVPGLSPQDQTLGDLLRNLTMYAHVVPGLPILVFVAWTLVVELLFYLGVWATRGWLVSRPLLVSATMLATVVLATAAAPIAPPIIAGLSMSLCFVPLLVMGQLAYFTRQRRISPATGTVGLLVAWSVFFVAVQRLNQVWMNSEGAHGFTETLFAFALFLLAIALEGTVVPPRIMRVVALRSYSLYLVHWPVGLAVLIPLMASGLSYVWCLAIALLLVAIATELVYRAVERPSIALGRRLGARVNAALASASVSRHGARQPTFARPKVLR